MSQKIIVLFAAVLFSLPLAARASTPAALKLALVDINQVLNATEEGKKIRKQLEEEMAGKRRSLEDKKKEIDKQEEEFQKQQLVLSKEALAARRAELDNKKMEFQKTLWAIQGEMQQKDKTFSEEMFRKISQVITKIAVDEKYDVIVSGEKPPAGLVLYAREGMDLTSQVIQLYNKTNPGKKEKGK